jgi:CheY-like chemotaxis protein
VSPRLAYYSALAEARRKTCPASEPSAPPGVTCGHGVQMTFEPSAAPNTAGGKRVLVVEDELMIRMLLEGMLTDLGYSVAAEAGSIDEALSLANAAQFDVAVLDVNLNDKPITPVVEVLVRRGVPFVFASGYGRGGVPEAYRQNPTLQKPFQVEALALAIDAALAKPAS